MCLRSASFVRAQVACTHLFQLNRDARLANVEAQAGGFLEPPRLRPRLVKVIVPKDKRSSDKGHTAESLISFHDTSWAHGL